MAETKPKKSFFSQLFRDGRHPHLPLWSAGTIWIYDSDRHPANAALLVKHRKCVDTFSHVIAWFLLFLSFVIELVVSLLSNGSVVYLYPCAALSGAMWLFVLVIGEWPLRRGSPMLSYGYMCLLYWMLVMRLWSVSMCFISIAAGQQYYEANWAILQVEVIIPFSTQMDMKQFLDFYINAIFYISMIGFLVTLGALEEIWKALGGSIRLVQTQVGILLPEVVPLLLIACLSIYYDQQALTLAPWASDHSSTALVWQSAMAGLTIISVVLVSAAALLWEPSFVLHAFIGVVFTPMAIVTLGTASAANAFASSIPGFVSANWGTISLFVPEDYRLQESDKYTTDVRTPMLAASVSGFLLSALLMAGVLMHVTCAVILLKAGPALAEVRRKQIILHNNLVMTTWKQQSRTGSSAGGVSATGAPNTPKTPLLYAASPFGRTSTAGVAASAASAPSDASAAIKGSGPNSKTGLLGAMIGSLQDTPGSEDFMAELKQYQQASARGGGGAAAGGGAFSFTDHSIESSSSSGSSAMPSPHNYVELSKGDMNADLLDVARGGSAARARPSVNVLSGAGLRTAFDDPRDPQSAVAKALQSRMKFPKDQMLHDREEVATVARGRLPPAQDIGRVALAQTKALWGAHRTCFASAVLMSVLAIVGMGSGLGVLQTQGKCGVLVQNAPSVTYVKSFGVWHANTNTITITHNWPYGSVEVVALVMDPTDDNFTVEVTSWAPNPSLLMSFEAFNSSFSFGDYLSPDDDVNGGFTDVNLVFNLPPDTGDGCMGLRVRLTTSYYANYVIVTKSATVNVTGDLVEVVENSQFASKTLSSLAITTGSGPVALTDIHIEPPFLITQFNNIAPALSVTSGSGDVYLTRVLAVSPLVNTGGDIRSENVISSAPQVGCSTTVNGELTPSMCGDIKYVTSGSGTIAITKSIGANNFYVQSESGVIVVANSALLIGRVASIVSVGGANIFLSTWLQAFGNETFVSTSGSVSVTAMLTNRLIVQLTGMGSFTCYVGLFGLSNGGPLVKPLVVGYYATPLLSVSTENGAIRAIAVQALANATSTNIRLSSVLGNIKVEMASDGFFGNYTVVAPRGKSVVEISGNEGPTTGYIGNLNQGTGTMEIITQGGDVQFTSLDSII